ncbi:universal stress protein [Streptomyces sp. NBC_01549]|uniref:universal stress protein n=1 Tax=Streptomyces sp. NBC_01549 TaxID=2975874 RepID=UPI00224F6AC0|nr:universal stress protein [Streptomyces sp. NBC_01549]MCX4595893.1 universal stress protein [Streptomyces sp. NBC_01549]
MALPLIVGIDGSDSSLLAVDWAVDEAARRRLPLRLVHASLWERYERAQPSFTTDRPAEKVTAQHIIASCVERARLRNPEVKASGEILPDDAVDVHRQPVEGPVHRVLLEASAQDDLIVVGAVRRHGHFGLQLGRTAHALLHHSECPVAVVPQPA